MTDQSRDWRQPQLLVLSRGTAEEAVLSFCKGGAVAGPLGSVGGCFERAGQSQNCKTTACSSQSTT